MILAQQVSPPSQNYDMSLEDPTDDEWSFFKKDENDLPPEPKLLPVSVNQLIKQTREGTTLPKPALIQSPLKSEPTVPIQIQPEQPKVESQTSEP